MLDDYKSEISKVNMELFERTLCNKLGVLVIQDEIAKIVMSTLLAKQASILSQILIANVFLPKRYNTFCKSAAKPSMIVMDSIIVYVISKLKTVNTLFYVQL